MKKSEAINEISEKLTSGDNWVNGVSFEEDISAEYKNSIFKFKDNHDINTFPYGTNEEEIKNHYASQLAHIQADEEMTNTEITDLANFLYQYENIVIKLIQDLASVGVEMNDKIISKITSTLNQTIQKNARAGAYNDAAYDKNNHITHLAHYYGCLQMVQDSNLRPRNALTRGGKLNNKILNKLKNTYSLLHSEDSPMSRPRWCDRFNSSLKKILEEKENINNIEKMDGRAKEMIIQGLNSLQTKSTSTGGRNGSLKKTIPKKKNKGGKKTRRIN